MQGLTKRELLSAGAMGLSLALFGSGRAFAQSRAKTLRYVTSSAVNSLDPVAFGATVESTAVSCGTYDRLVRMGSKPYGEFKVYDFSKIEGELAERYEVSEDRKTFSFYLRKDAVWHDGTPVTAADVQWSLQRAVTAETMSRAQMETGSITKAATFEIVDPTTIKITLAAADRLALPDLTTLFAPMMNSTLVKKNAGEADPWGVEWLKTNTAGGGAYTVEKFVPGDQVVLKRNDAWKSGSVPDMERVIVQSIPAAATRRNLIERGDADITLQLQIADLISLEKAPNVTVASLPMPTAFVALIFNTRMEPFDNVKVRQAIAAAVPYDDILKTAVLGRGGKLYGATWSGEPPTPAFPQPMPTNTDIELAKKTLAEAGFPNGFETTLSYGAYRSEWADIAAPLLQEALAKIGIKVKIEKLADAQFAEAVTKKTLPMLIERSLAYFPAADYFFRVFLSGEQRWNFSSWKNARVNEILPVARFEVDPAKYDAMAKELISILQQEQPMVMLWSPTLPLAMASSLSGFTVWPHYNLDYRNLARKA